MTPGERAPEIFRRPIVVALRGLATGFFVSPDVASLSLSVFVSQTESPG